MDVRERSKNIKVKGVAIVFNPEYGDFDKMFSVLSYDQLEQLAKSALDELIHRAYTDGYENGSNDVIENFKKIER